MEGVLSTEVVAGILTGLFVLVLGLLGLQLWSSLQIRRMSKTAYQDDVRKAQRQAVEIVSDAQQEAEAVLSEANEASTKAMVKASQAAEATNRSYQAELQNILDRYNDQLGKTLKRGDESFAALTTAAADSFNRRQEVLNTQFDDVLEQLNTVAGTLNTQTTGTMKKLEESIDETMQNLQTMLKQGEVVVQQHVAEHLEGILDRAEADVDAYRNARLKLLDRHIERLIEDVAIRVLHKKLTLDEHADLAIKALQDARDHNVL